MPMRALSAAVFLVVLAANAQAKMLKPGEPFPSWKMKDHTGAFVSSSDLAGKTYLLWFYPKAMTSGCTKEGQGLRDRNDELKKLHLTILGVSFDDPETNKQFVEREGFPFALLSDADHELATKVGAALISLQPVASRISYLVGPDGKVLKAYDRVDPATHAGEVERDLRALSAK
ncbi:MAG TPA: peroxiredoxin [Candidatus Binatia bacterium]|nr:peroxiredoxin [Candidatus Binatia bacterium]